MYHLLLREHGRKKELAFPVEYRAGYRSRELHSAQVINIVVKVATAHGACPDMGGGGQVP